MRIAIDAAELVATETMLAFHREEVQAILGVFEGEICIVEKETPEGARQVLSPKTVQPEIPRKRNNPHKRKSFHAGQGRTKARI
jgi:hypothetical protein